MVNASIKYLGGIESGDYSNPEFVTLTGSSTLVKFESDLKNVSVLIDYGIFQGGNADEENNEKVDNEAIKADFMILTHAHLDHSGRVPFLVKNGYLNPIYMTELTALQSREMLLDFVKVTERKITAISLQNEKKESIFNHHLFIIDAYTKLKGDLSKEDRKKLKSKVSKKLGSESVLDLENAFEKAKKYCEDNNVYSIKDLVGKLEKVPVLLYNDLDIEKMFSLVHIIKTGEEEVLNDFFYIDTYNKKTLTYILDKVLNGYSEQILIDNKVFNELNKELSDKIEKTKKALLENARIKKDNEELSDKLEEALNFVLSVNREQAIEKFDEYHKFLKKYHVEDYSEIDDVLEKPLKIKYSLELLAKTKKLLKIKVKTNEDRNKKIIDSIRLNFLDAGHIEGSVQAVITVVTEKVDTALRGKNKDGFSRKNKKHTNFLFSGDLGRIRDPNLAGRPGISDFKLDYIQMESTYAGRNHPNRVETEKEFFDEIASAEAKVLIPTFSMQRTQEILMLLLEDMYNKKGDKDELVKLKLELDEIQANYDLIENKDSIQAKNLLRTIEILKNDISEIKKSSFFQNIVLDSPLSEKITSIYIDKLGDKYDLLNPQVQEKLFGRVVIRYIRDRKEQEDLYKAKREYRKEIIISSSGMCEGGAVIAHLKANLQNPKSKIIFVGYTPPNCRGGKIKSGNSVDIDLVKYNVDCKVADIKGFSGHIDQDEIIQLLGENTINRGATISLTHGNDNREGLKEKVLKEVLKTRKSIKVLIPELGDTIEVKI
ncbi:MAG: MBL fold metallo-hydrolase [Candidatus Gracilibacteria bacterium]|nr:MBL fold metallo-hydrolase [Candidatus Gracilibacteria bacterium]